MEFTVLEYYEECNVVVKNLMQFSPIWSKTVIQRYFKFFIQYYILLAGIIISLAICNRAFRSPDLDTTTECLIPAVSLAAFIFRISPMILYRNRLTEVYIQLDASFRSHFNSKSVIPLEELTVKTIYGLMKYLYVTCKMILFGYCVVPLIFLLYEIIAHVEPLIYPLPFPSLYPEGIADTTIGYCILYIFESFNVLFDTCTVIGSDCLFGLFAFQIFGILNAHSFKISRTDVYENYSETLQGCIKEHCELMHCSHLLESIYGPMVLSQRITDATVLCAVIWQMNKIAGSDMGKVFFYFVWIILKFLQQFTYGWYGSLLTSESEKFQEAVYCSNWSNYHDRKFASSVLVILTQKPIRISACQFFVISVTMASSVIRASVSYFCLLKTLDQ